MYTMMIRVWRKSTPRDPLCPVCALAVKEQANFVDNLTLVARYQESTIVLYEYEQETSIIDGDKSAVAYIYYHIIRQEEDVDHSLIAFISCSVGARYFAKLCSILFCAHLDDFDPPPPPSRS